MLQNVSEKLYITCTQIKTLTVIETLRFVYPYITKKKAFLPPANAQTSRFSYTQPDNVFCRRIDGGELEVKVGDFGLCKRIDDNPKTRCGSWPYAAPEVFSNPGKYDEKCDVWSFGCTIFEMLTGSVPFYPSITQSDPHFDFTKLLALVHVSSLGLFIFHTF